MNMFVSGRKEVGEAVLIAGLVAAITGLVELGLRRWEKHLKKKEDAEKKVKKNGKSSKPRKSNKSNS